ncbi:MAG: YceI family protein [Bacteroidia bacterium]|jgi:polyisoprenoid-binding protein YceI|nr:YceI family protein [Bacteroidia bacterium]
MKKLVLSLFIVAGVMDTASAQTNWGCDNAHSSVMFAIEHMTVAKTIGWFGDYEIKMTTNKADFSDAVLEVTLKSSSINTGNEQRDGHLKSADFFDAEKNPTITFKSTSFKKIKDNMYEVKGNLTMKGVTKEITLEAVYGGEKKDPYGNVKSGWSVRTKIDRTQYGMAWNAPLEGGGNILGNMVEIMCDIELIKKK